MKRTKKMNVVLAMVLSMTLLFGATISANAASASVLLTVEQTDVNTAVTIPGQIPIIFNADGTNTYPTNWTIYNNSESAGVVYGDITNPECILGRCPFCVTEK